MKILSVVGARPNFMKIAPFLRVIDDYNNNWTEKIEHCLVHTGQHYDDRMRRLFFESLDIPQADINLNIGSGSHAEQVDQTNGRTRIIELGLLRHLWQKELQKFIIKY